MVTYKETFLIFMQIFMYYNVQGLWVEVAVP